MLSFHFMLHAWRMRRNSSVCALRHLSPCVRALSACPDILRAHRSLRRRAHASTGPPIGRRRRRAAVGATAAGAAERAAWARTAVGDGDSLREEARPSYLQLVVKEKGVDFAPQLINAIRCPTCGERTGEEMQSSVLVPCSPGASCAGGAAAVAGNSSLSEAC